MRFERPYRLHRLPERGIVAGVCAGIADYFGIDVAVVRIAFVVSLFFFIVPAGLGYVALAIILKPRPPNLYQSGEEEAFWRGVNTAPEDALSGLRRTFAEMEERLRRMESQVTSKDFELHRKFRDLDKG